MLVSEEKKVRIFTEVYILVLFIGRILHDPTFVDQIEFQITWCIGREVLL